jgi:hypothetical protein
MRVIISCPVNAKHKQFLASAHVMERWEVDEHGSFVRKRGDMTRMEARTAAPTCADCGTEAKMTKVN